MMNLYDVDNQRFELAFELLEMNSKAREICA